MAAAKATENHGDKWGMTWYLQLVIYNWYLWLVWKQVNPGCLSIWIGISPLAALLLGIFLITFSTSFTETGWKENFSCIKYWFLILTILGWFLNFLMVLFSICSLNLHYSRATQKCLTFLPPQVFPISSLFTNKVSFSTISFVFVVISSFSIRIILESPYVC